jgi:hypothetical protein
MPFDGESSGEICGAILRDEPVPPVQLNPRTQSKVRYLRSRSEREVTGHRCWSDSLSMMGSAALRWFAQPWIGCAI